MADIQALREQEYSTNLVLLAQQMKPKLSPYCKTQSATGSEAFRMLSQISETAAVIGGSTAAPAMNVEINHDGRWVYPQNIDWGRYVDSLDMLQTNIKPMGAYVQSAIAAMNRAEDDLFTSAFFGKAQTGKAGGTSTLFDSNNVVPVNFGGANEGLTVAKLRSAKKILLQNEIDLDMEQITVGVSPEQHDDLLALTVVTSTDFNSKPVLVDGKVQQFLGMNFVISNRLPVDGNSYRRLPVWVTSGMGCGVWKETNSSIRNDPSKQRNPYYIEAGSVKGFTRLDEARCLEIKCLEA